MRTVAFFCVGAGAAPGCGGAGILSYFPTFPNCSKLIWKPAKQELSPTPPVHLITDIFFGKILLGKPQ